MVLRRKMKRVTRQFQYLHSPAGVALSRESQSFRRELWNVLGVDFVPVPMPLPSLRFLIERVCDTFCVNGDFMRSQPHSPALLQYCILLWHQVNNVIFRIRAQLGASRVHQSQAPRIFNHCQLESETDSEEWDIMSSRVFYCSDLSFGASRPKPSRHQ